MPFGKKIPRPVERPTEAACNWLLQGAGKDLDQAREPAIVERDGTKVAFLAYSTILFPGYEARPGKPGCTPISIITDYAMSEIEQPGCEAVVTTVVHPSSLRVLREDIARAREHANIVVVSVHWGIHFTPVEVRPVRV